MFWNTAFIISFIVCAILVVIFVIILWIMKRRFYRIKSENVFVKDDMISEKTLAKKINRLFQPSEKITDVINKYVISFTNQKCFLVCKYDRIFSSVSMKVFSYNEKEELIQVYDIIETGHLSHSSLISLPEGCMYVNIVINGVDDIFTGERKNVGYYKALIGIETLALFFGLFFIAYILFLLIVGNSVDAKLKSSGLLLSFIPNIIICFFNYNLILRSFFIKRFVDLGRFYK